MIEEVWKTLELYELQVRHQIFSSGRFYNDLLIKTTELYSTLVLI